MKITVVDTDNVQDKSFKLHRPLGRPDYLFVLFKSSARVLADGEYTNADSGSFIIFDKHEIQSYCPQSGKEFIHDFMHFDAENDYERSLLADIPKGKLISLSGPHTVSRILSEIRSELIGTSNKYKSALLTHLGAVFLLRLRSDIENTRISDTSKIHYREMCELRASVYRDPTLDWSIEKMAHSVCLSRSYFQYLYKRFFGISCNEDIINARISNAKILLSTGNMSINEVADKCGYSSTEHFIRQFRQRTDVTPKNFRSK